MLGMVCCFHRSGRIVQWPLYKVGVRVKRLRRDWISALRSNGNPCGLSVWRPPCSTIPDNVDDKLPRHRTLSSPQAGTELPHETPHNHPIFTRTSSIHLPTCLTLLFTILSRVARTLFVFAFLSSPDICTTFFIASISVSPSS